MTKEQIAGKRNLVYKYALKLCRDVDEAEDLTQDVLVKAITSMGTYNPSYSGSTWLARITLNTWKDNSRRTNYIEPIDLDELHVIGDENVNVSTELILTNWNVNEVVRLRCVNGLTNMEISKKLKVPIGTVKSRMFRHTNVLRRKYAYKIKA